MRPCQRRKDEAFEKYKDFVENDLKEFPTVSRIYEMRGELKEFCPQASNPADVTELMLQARSILEKIALSLTDLEYLYKKFEHIHNGNLLDHNALFTTSHIEAEANNVRCRCGEVIDKRYAEISDETGEPICAICTADEDAQ